VLTDDKRGSMRMFIMYSKGHAILANVTAHFQFGTLAQDVVDAIEFFHAQPSNSGEAVCVTPPKPLINGDNCAVPSSYSLHRYVRCVEALLKAIGSGTA
jgi:hypothetical protein